MNMEQKQMLKKMVEFNQTAFDNTFNAMTLLQDQFKHVAKTVLEQANWLPAEGRKAIELQKALNEVKTLRGFIPICSSCKKIRDDKGFWQQVEIYISAHSDAVISHGICPECVNKLYPEFLQDK